MKTYENPFHRGHLYFVMEDQDTADEILQKIEDLLRKEERPLQTGVFSDNSERIRLLRESGFFLKRKCYEMDVCQSDLISPAGADGCELLTAEKGSDAYSACAERIFHHYARTHAQVNPLTASHEAFSNILPAQALYMETDGVIRAVAFIEKNEIAYLTSDSPGDLPSFLEALLERMFTKYDRVIFEADDVDPSAMALMSMFSKRPSVSFDAYIKAR